MVQRVIHDDVIAVTDFYILLKIMFVFQCLLEDN